MKKYSQQDIINKIYDLYKDEYELKSTYKGSTKPIILLHKKCNKTYEVKRAKNFITEHRGLCPYCKDIKSHSTKKVTEDEFIKRLYNEVKDEYSYISGFINVNKKLLLRHNICGNEFYVSPHMFLGSKHTRCPVCSNSNRGKYAIKENYLESLLKESKYGDEYEWLESYKNNNKLKHKILHKVCNNTYYVRPNDFQQGYLCPYCHSSKEQKDVYTYIKSFYKDKIKYNYRIGNKEIDIYIPKLKIGFEYNGFYWHCDKNVDKNYHLNKLKYFKEKGIDIYFIESTDWKNKQEIVKHRIKHILQCNDAKKIYARNTDINFNLSKDEKSKFLNTYHMQGNCIDSFNFYLSYNNEVVAIMTFTKGRKNVNSKKLELTRFAINYNYIIIGGFSKLLYHSINYIKENYSSYKEVISYADINWSRGNVYIKNGFTLDHISKPSYYYTNRNNDFINRYKFRKSELEKLYPEYYKKDLTEFQIVDQIPYTYRVWNCGNYVFNYKL